MHGVLARASRTRRAAPSEYRAKLLCARIMSRFGCTKSRESRAARLLRGGEPRSQLAELEVAEEASLPTAQLNVPTASLKKKTNQKPHPNLWFLLNNSSPFPERSAPPVKWERCDCGGLYNWGHLAVTPGENTPRPR